MMIPYRTAKSLLVRSCMGLLLLCVATAVRPASSDPVRMGFRLLEAQGRVLWSDTAQMQLGGLPVSYRRFSSGESPAGTAEAFARTTGMFDQALAFKGLVVLSGTRDGWHWVAEIGTGTRGTRGLVSALPVGTGVVSGEPGLGAKAAPSWVPTDATLRFDQVLLQGEVRVRQRLYTLPHPPPQAWLLLRTRLADLGWSPAPRGQGMAPAGVETWERRRSRLLLALLPEETGSALLTHLQE